MKVLCVNHLQPNCGVYQFFRRMTAPLLALEGMYYIETNQEWEFDYWCEQIQPDIVLYNFYFSGVTMSWLSDYKIAASKNRFKQICLYHEGDVFSKGFDLVLHQDPTNTDERYFTMSRPIPKYNKEYKENDIPIFGTFGFGLGGKGFTRVVETVQNEYDAAIIRMNIPFAHFGDPNGDGGRRWADLCRQVKTKPDIELQITHNLLPEQELLEWLSEHTVNCFFYDHNGGRGISGTTDYALAVKRPIAITESDQFHHLWRYDRRMLIEENTLHDIINNGAGLLEKFHEKWNTTTLVNDFLHAFNRSLQ